jgi:hypothetical protein
MELRMAYNGPDSWKVISNGKVIGTITKEANGRYTGIHTASATGSSYASSSQAQSGIYNNERTWLGYCS